MRGSVVLVLGVLAVARVGGADDESTDPTHGPARWQAASGAPALSRIWGAGNDLYGVGSSGAYRSTDGGASWSPVDGAGPATGVWGTGTDDVWIVRARTLHHSYDGAHWSTQALPMLSFGAAIEGMWGADRDRYVFGVDRVDGKPRGVILRSRDGGTSWRAESIPEVDRIAGIWGSAANDVYAVGAKGIVLHSTGDGWTTVRQPTGSGLEGIWGASATSIYVVGANGTILHSTDGKAWSPRTSGVRYTLSSINGSGNELFAGSSDGPPLRSLDGLTWKPVTALIERGSVWTGGARPVLASTDVQFLGESTPIERPKGAPPLPGAQTSAQMIEVESSRYGNQYPDARNLQAIAAYRMGGPRALDPALLALNPPTFSYSQMAGCTKSLDTSGAFSNPGPVSLVANVVCTWTTCRELTMSASITTASSRGAQGFLRSSVKVSAPSCSDQTSMAKDALQAIRESALKEYEKSLNNRLSQLPAQAGPDARIDALAAYVLDGGSDPTVRSTLAASLGQPVTWPGFWWNRRDASLLCGTPAETTVSVKADGLLQQGSFGAALIQLDRIASCGQPFRMKAYLAACRAKRFGAAREHYDALGRPQAMAQICMKEGYDPRSPQPPTTP